ncbi:MAG: S-layer homology domain-containing protein [Oscillospiraceae bacterium]|nr:S-layer homology domain-containing protein [Oscillospiraceae bacterium]
MKRRKITAWVLTLSLVLTLVFGTAITAHAEPVSFGLWVGDSDEITEAGPVQGTGAESGTAAVSVEDDGIVLTLDGFHYKGEGAWTGSDAGKLAAAIYYIGDAPLTVVLAGESVVTCENDSAYVSGLNSYADITFTGDGSLTVAGGAADNRSFGIYAENSLTVENVELTALADAAGISFGIYVNKGDFTVAGGSVTAMGGKVAVTGGVEACSTGISCNCDIAVEDGALTASGDTVTVDGDVGYAHSAGIISCGSLSVTGGSVTAKSDDIKVIGEVSDRAVSSAVFGFGAVTISGGAAEVSCGKVDAENSDSVGLFGKTVTISGDDTKVHVAAGDAEVSIGIEADGTLEILGGKVSAEGGGGKTASLGIYAKDDISISGGTIQALGADAGEDSFGLNSRNGGLTVTGGKISPVGGTAAHNSKGIEVPGDISITGGMVIAGTGEEAGFNSVGIDTEGSLSITGDGTLVAGVGKTAGNCSGGINARGDITITGGLVMARAGEAGEGTTSSIGLCSSRGRLTVRGANTELTAAGGKAGGGSDAVNVLLGVTVDGGTVTARGGTAPFSSGIDIIGPLDITDGIITAVGGDGSAEGGEMIGFSLGISCGTRINISGGELNAAGGAAKHTSCGILSMWPEEVAFAEGEEEIDITPYKDVCEITVTGGRVKISGGAAEENSYGAFADDSIKILGGEVNASGGDSEFSVGLSSADLTISGGKTEAFGQLDAFDYNTLTVSEANRAAFRIGDDAASAVDSTPEAYLEEFVKYVYAEYYPDSDDDDEDVPAAPAPAAPAGEDNNAAETYTDVSEDDWYYEAVDWAVSEGLMNGMDEDTFAPEDSGTRSTVVTMLWRLAGEPEAEKSGFKDLDADSWYETAVNWAAEAGIVLGTSEDTFSPDEPITREQVAVILYRYAQAQGLGFKGMWMFRLDYSDAGDISDYAYEAMCWMTMHGVIRGMGDGTAAPQAEATRAQIATMFMRFAEEISQ